VEFDSLFRSLNFLLSHISEGGGLSNLCTLVFEKRYQTPDFLFVILLCIFQAGTAIVPPCRAVSD
jgi:hypothetical protein